MYTASGSGVVVVEDDRVGRGHLGVVVPILGRLCQNKSRHYDLVKNKKCNFNYEGKSNITMYLFSIFWLQLVYEGETCSDRTVWNQ